MTGGTWFLRWMLRQLTRKSLRFWRRHEKTTNADAPPILATNELPATNTDLKNEVPHMGSEVTLLSSAREMGQGAGLQLQLRCQDSYCTDDGTGCDGRNYPCIQCVK